MRTLLTLALSVFLAALTSTADDWPQWRGPRRDGRSREKGLMRQWPASGPQKLWTVTGLGEGYSTVSVVGDTIFTTGMIGGQGKLFLISTKGRIIGAKTYGRETKGNGYPGARSTPTVAGDRVLVMSGEGMLYCFETKSGSILWQKDVFGQFGGRQITWSVAESVLVEGDMVVCTPGGDGGALAALSLKDGATIWRTNSDHKSAYCSPILVNHNDNRIILTMVEDGAVGIDAKTGRELWLHPHKNRYAVHAATPVYHKGRVVISSGYRQGTECLELNTDGTRARKIWEVKELDNHHGGIVRVGDAVVGTSDRGLICVDIETGRINWQERALGKGSITYADGLLYMYGERSKQVGIAEVSAETFGGLGGSFPVTEGTKEHWAHPVVANGVLYIRHGDALMAYKVSE